MTETQLAYLLAALFGAAFLFLLAQRWWRRRVASWRARSRNRVAQAGEIDAERLLEAAGYVICDRQVALDWQIACDAELVSINLRADLIVEREGWRYVAEVKTGEEAPRLRNAATRRQLLEYLVAYDVDGVLLVDVPGQRVRVVDFGVSRAAEEPAQSSAAEG